MKNTKLWITASVFAICSSSAFAQDATEETEVRQLQTVVVTGQKREQNAQDVSTAITALSSDGLKDKAVARIDDLQYASPAITITDAGLTQNVNIRGIGLASGDPAVANGVATYTDGIFQPPIVTTNSFYDIASVEVLRGPQGTFVGSNSTGGAIFINSQDPTFDDVNGYAEGTIGEYNLKGVEGAVNLPVNDKFAVRATGMMRDRDSFYSNAGPSNADPARLEEYSARVGLLWAPTDNFDALLKLEAAEKDTGGYAAKPNGSAVSGSDIRKLFYDSDTRNHEESNQASLRLNLTTSSGITVRSVTGYQKKEIMNDYDVDGFVNPFVPPSTRSQFVTEEVKTQEINIISPDTDRFSWIVGAYLQKNEILVDITENGGGGPRVDIDITNDKTTRGIFAHGSYDLTDTLEVEAGVRYSDYEVSGDGAVLVFVGPPGGLPVADLGGNHKDSKPTGKIGLNWTPSPDHLVYGFVARGYKSGGYASRTEEFRPETVTDYEIGWKGAFADGRINTQIGAFYYDYTDFQFDVLIGATGQTGPANLTNAELYGFEGQVQAQLGNWGFDGGFAYVDSSLSDTPFIDQLAYEASQPPGSVNLPQCGTGETPAGGTCSDYLPFTVNTGGGVNLFSPEVTYNVGAEYYFDFGNVSVTPRLNYSFIGEQFVYLGYDRSRDLIEDRGLLSGMVTVEFDRYKIQLYGTNLTDEEYVSGQAVGDSVEYYGSPRQIGIRFGLEF